MIRYDIIQYMKNKINIIFWSILGMLVMIPNVFSATNQGSKSDLMNATSSFYLAQEHVSLLQRVFGVATAPQIMMIVSIIAIISFVGIVYLGFGFVILLFINQD